MITPDIAQIADKLTKAQTTALASDPKKPVSPHLLPIIVRDRALAVRLMGDEMHVTPLGIAVRNHLSNQTRDAK